MNRKLLDDQLKIFNDKQSEIEGELAKLEKIENEILAELSGDGYKENKDDLENNILLIKDAQSDLSSFLKELKDVKKEFQQESEAAITKLRIRKHKLKKEAIMKEKYQRTLNPSFKSKKIIWENKDGRLNLLEGFLGDQKVFEIKRGITTFSLKVSNKNMLEYDKAHYSLDLIKLQKKAEAIFSSSLVS